MYICTYVYVFAYVHECNNTVVARADTWPPALPDVHPDAVQQGHLLHVPRNRGGHQHPRSRSEEESAVHLRDEGQERGEEGAREQRRERGGVLLLLQRKLQQQTAQGKFRDM